MDSRTAVFRFKEADSLYRDGRYDEALDRLIELDEAFPNTPNILFPLARCLRHAGRIDEALGICDDLITRCGDLRALELREFIRKSHDPAAESTPHPHIHSIEGLNQDVHAGVLDDLLGPPPVPPSALLPAEGPKPYMKYALIGVGILIAVVLIALPVVMRPTGESPPLTQQKSTQTQQSLPYEAQDSPGIPAPLSQEELDAQGVKEFSKDFFGQLALALTINVASLTFTLYLTLKVCNRLPYDSPLDDLISTGGMAVLLMLVLLIPCLGIVIGIIILRKVYEFGIVEFLILIGFNVASGIVIGLIYLIGMLATGQFPG